MSASGEGDHLLVEGRSCWRRVRADRLAFLVDGAAYFAALADAIERAERQVILVGWDFHSRVRLRPDDEGSELAMLLDAAVRARRRLHVHVLGWDFAMIYALEREALPLYRFGVRTHRRVRFRLDGRHPLGACHHQKLAVVDDRIAFAGGIDVTAGRWDTREHRARDPRRTVPGRADVGPFHDLQLAVGGEAAGALGELARERWRRATDHELPRPEVGGDPWPGSLAPALRDVEVGIARTEPAFEGRAEVREIEALYLRGIASARRCLYLENQYLTAARVGEALAERLRDPSGPEVVIVGPARSGGWLEQTTMGVLRARLVRRLHEVDRQGRLRLYHPVVPDLGDQRYTLHAKVMMVDDRLLRVGSANLSNRSMGLDTECDLALEGRDETVRSAIAGLRNELLAEHLDVAPERVAAAIAERGSLIAAIESLRSEGRSLVPLETDIPEWLDDLVPESAVVDPERPVELEELAAALVPEEIPERERPLLWRTGAVVAVLVGLAVAWHLTPLGDAVAPGRLAEWVGRLRGTTLGPLAAGAGMTLAGCLMVPITAMTVAAALVFGWRVGFGVALGASVASATLGYLLGRALWRDAVRRLAGRRLDRVSRALGERGITSVVLLRVVPIAPFTVVNLVAGATRIRLRDFVLGTLLAMAPGTLLLALFAEGAVRAIVDPGLETGLVAGAAVLALVLLVHLVRRHLAGSTKAGSESS